MSGNRIAIIKLARGEVGFYDDLTRIHLTLSRPSADVYDNMNTAKLRRGVSGRVIELVAGSLMPTSRKEVEVEKACEKLHVEQSKPEVVIEAVEVEQPVVEEKVEPVVKETKPKAKTKAAAKKKDKDEE